MSTESADEISIQLLRRLTRNLSSVSGVSAEEAVSDSDDSVELDLKDKVFTQDYAKKLARGGAMQDDPIKQQRARLEALLASTSPLDLKSNMKISRIDVQGGER